MLLRRASGTLAAPGFVMVRCEILFALLSGFFGVNGERLHTENGCDEKALAVCTRRIAAHQGSWGISEIANELSVAPGQVRDMLTALGVLADPDCATLCRALQSTGEALLGNAIPDKARSACLDDTCSKEVQMARPCFASAQPGTLETANADVSEELPS